MITLIVNKKLSLRGVADRRKEVGEAGAARGAEADGGVGVRQERRHHRYHRLHANVAARSLLSTLLRTVKSAQNANLRRVRQPECGIVARLSAARPERQLSKSWSSDAVHSTWEEADAGVRRATQTTTVDSTLGITR